MSRIEKLNNTRKLLLVTVSRMRPPKPGKMRYEQRNELKHVAVLFAAKALEFIYEIVELG